MKPCTENDVYIYGLDAGGGGRVFRCINANLIELAGNIYSYKVIVPKSGDNVRIGMNPPQKLIGIPEILGPNMGFTQTFISFGCFATKFEAKAKLQGACKSYTTKLCS